MGTLAKTIKVAALIPYLVFSAFGLFFAVIGSTFVFQQMNQLQDTKAMQAWTPVPCTIERSEVEDHGEDYRLGLAYAYEVDGYILRSAQYSSTEYLTAESMGEIDRAQQRYPVGHKTTCFYNPENTKEAILVQPSIKSAKTAIALTLLFPGFGLFFATIPWLGLLKKRKQKTDPFNTPITPPEKSKPKAPLIIFGSLFFLIGAGVFYPMGIKPMIKMQEAKSWSTTDAVVISSKVKRHESSDSSDTFSAYIAYSYQIDGHKFIGDQYSFIGGSDSGYNSKAAIVRAHPPGHKMIIFINPEDPAESVINPKPAWSMLFGLIPLVFCVVGLAIIIAGTRNAKAKNLDQTQAGQIVVHLKGKSRVGKFIGILIFGLIWNGVVVVLFISNAPFLFKAIFGFFGLALIAGAIHALLACFNPRAMVEIRPGNLVPGAKAAMRWSFTGRPDRITLLKVSLHCFKVKTVTRKSGGKTETRTEHISIYEEELFSSDHINELAQGTLEFTLPPDRPASRAGHQDGIEWRLHFNGDIPKWPDIKEEFKFLVYPNEH